jgi:hypothetical protein
MPNNLLVLENFTPRNCDSVKARDSSIFAIVTSKRKRTICVQLGRRRACAFRNEFDIAEGERFSVDQYVP